MNENTLNLAGLSLLRKPFEDHQISLLPKPYKKDSQKGDCKECGNYHGLPAVHLKYVGHAALTDRLLEADPLWSWEPLALTDQGLPLFDQNGGLWIKLTVCGHTRLGYGSAESSAYKEVGSREKEVIGDALRNSAMRFGAALDLWHKGDLHGDDGHTDNNDNKNSTSNLSSTHEKPMPTPKATEGHTIGQKPNRSGPIANENKPYESKIKPKTDSIATVSPIKPLDQAIENIDKAKLVKEANAERLKLGWSKEQFIKYLVDNFGKDSDLTYEEATMLLASLKRQSEKP